MSKVGNYGFIILTLINRECECLNALTSSNLDTIPHTNMIQYFFNIEAKVMETSDLMAWECKIFTHEFIEF